MSQFAAFSDYTRLRFRPIPLFPNMTGRDLLVALGRTKRRVMVIEAGAVIAQISAQDAIGIVRDAPYGGSGTKHKVTAIYRIPPQPRVLPDAPYHPFELCYRTTEAPVLPASPEWFRDRGYA